MDTITAIDTIRTVRRFSPEPLTGDEVRAILHAGRRAGSSKNLQRWDFVVVRDRDRLAALGDAGPWAGHVRGASVAIALVTPDPRAAGAPLSIVFDIGRAAQNMVLAAWAHGIGSCPATVYEQDLCRAILGYPETHHCEYILSFGKPEDAGELTRPNRAGGRKPLDQLVHAERW
jgi:nitroreductase